MANLTAKTSSNIFYKARCEAATHNEQLSSREGAADYMSIDRGRLYRIESGIAVPYPERNKRRTGCFSARCEYLVILVAYVAAWKAINYLFDSFEELESERNRRKKRSRRTARMRDYR